jgi:KaiC/GvpD/RAD55 family RecA-like ATPase
MLKLILTKPEKLEKSLVNVIKSASKNVISILSTRPYSSFHYAVDKVCSKGNCFFIDTLSEPSAENAIYISSENLTSLSIAINQAQQSFKGKSTIVFDSLDNLAIRNPPGVLIKFFMFILTRARDWGADVVIISSKFSSDSQLLNTIKQSVDKVENN